MCKYISNKLYSRIYNNYINYQISYTASEIITTCECSNIQNLVAPLDSFDTVNSITASYDPILDINTIDLTEESNDSDNEETLPEETTPALSSGNVVLNLYKR